METAWLGLAHERTKASSGSRLWPSAAWSAVTYRVRSVPTSAKLPPPQLKVLPPNRLIALPWLDRAQHSGLGTIVHHSKFGRQ